MARKPQPSQARTAFAMLLASLMAMSCCSTALAQSGRAGAQAISVNGWYYVPVRVSFPAGWNERDCDRICDEAQRVWHKARIGFSFTVERRREGITPLATFDLHMAGAAGLYTSNGRVQVDPSLTLVARGRVLAHELGHDLGLPNVDDSKRLMGPLADANKSGLVLTDDEVRVARATCAQLAR